MPMIEIAVIAKGEPILRRTANGHGDTRTVGAAIEAALRHWNVTEQSRLLNSDDGLIIRVKCAPGSVARPEVRILDVVE